jgi:dolichyl-phosphate-mannose--protein O-mannosyl transferase
MYDSCSDALLVIATTGWALHFLPFVFVARDCFLTYYVLAAYFALLTLTIVIDLLFGSGNGNGSAVGGPNLTGCVVMGSLGAT